MDQNIDFAQNASVAGQTQVLQIIVGALAIGVIAFAMIVYFIHGNRAPAEGREGPAVITFVAIAFAIGSAFAQLVVPKLLVAAGQKALKIEVTQPGAEAVDSRTVIQRLLAIFTTKTIVGCALAEGAAFFALIAYMIEGSVIGLLLASAFLVMIILRFPTETSIRNWCEDAVRDL